MSGIQVLITINSATFVTVLILTIKLIRHFTRMELEHELMWTDYTKRTGYRHKRRTDE